MAAKPWGDTGKNMAVLRLCIVVLVLSLLLAACPSGLQAGQYAVVTEGSRDIWVINCTSLGYPPVNVELFTCENAARLLDESAPDFINHSRGAAASSHEFSLYEWYSDNFSADEADTLAHITHFAMALLAESPASGLDVRDYDYDWRLNDVI